MKNIKDFIFEDSKISTSEIEFDNISGKVLYKVLVNSFKKHFEIDLQKTLLGKGKNYLTQLYNDVIKDADGNEINEKGTYCIGQWCDLRFKNNLQPFKWDKHKFEYVVTDEALKQINDLFEKYWDQSVISGHRHSQKSKYGNFYTLQFKFPEGDIIQTNADFGSGSELLKYVVKNN